MLIVSPVPARHGAVAAAGEDRIRGHQRKWCSDKRAPPTSDAA